MSRTKWKGPIISDTTSKQQKLYLNRNSQILPKHVGLKVVSHNGKENIEILVEESMVGHKIGEFALTRARFAFKKKRNKKK